MLYSCWVCVFCDIFVNDFPHHSSVSLINSVLICFINRLAEEVALTCYEQRDIHGLHLVHTSAKNNNDRALLAKVEGYITKLSDKR